MLWLKTCRKKRIRRCRKGDDIKDRNEAQRSCASFFVGCAQGFLLDWRGKSASIDHLLGTLFSGVALLGFLPGRGGGWGDNFNELKTSGEGLFFKRFNLGWHPTKKFWFSHSSNRISILCLARLALNGYARRFHPQLGGRPLQGGILCTFNKSFKTLCQGDPSLTSLLSREEEARLSSVSCSSSIDVYVKFSN